MKDYDIRDISLAPSGHRKIEWVKNNMPLLSALEEEFRKDKPFDGMKISLSVHLEAKTAYLCLVLAEGGAQMSVTGSNSLSTQDDVAAALEMCIRDRWCTTRPDMPRIISINWTSWSWPMPSRFIKVREANSR